MKAPGRQTRPVEESYRRAFGQRVRELRERVGLKQEALAHAIEMSPRYLSGIERGEANPTLDQLVRLAKGLSIDIQDLLPAREQ